MLGKKNTKLPEIPANQDNSEEICKRIRAEADEEVKSILFQARVKVKEILDAAEKEAAGSREAIRAGSGREIQKEKEKNVSLLNLEKKRLILGAQDKFIQQVFERIRQSSGEFRQDKDNYSRFLEKAVAEGLKVLAIDDAVVFYAPEDEGLFKQGALKSVKARQGEFSDPGVVIRSSDGRLFFDNRLVTRLERIKDKIYMELLKG